MQHDNPNHKLSKNIPLSLFSIKNELKQKCINVNNFLSPLSNEEKVFIHTIKERTKLLNKNNVTRTRAYYQFYVQYPEIHWALLGHMVSRNGGWNMTDLRGDLYTKILSEKEQITFFLF
ncbi:Dipicolinate synthase, A chain [Bacillus cereus]|nr:Dipicolinate synthase, A chain [Bacillus cereus]